MLGVRCSSPLARRAARSLLSLAMLWLMMAATSSQATRADTNYAGLVIVFEGNAVQKTCVSFSENQLSGLALLQRDSSLAVVSNPATSGGDRVCKINSLGCTSPEACVCRCEGSSCTYWNYWRWGGNDWVYVGPNTGDRVVRNGDIDAWVWGSGDADRPPTVSLTEICGASVPTPTDTTVPPSPTETNTLQPTPTHTPTTTGQPTLTRTPTPRPTLTLDPPTATTGASDQYPATTDTPGPSATPLPTETPQPTEVPQPTDTPPPAEASPTPSSPAPETETPTPQPQPTESSGAYPGPEGLTPTAGAPGPTVAGETETVQPGQGTPMTPTGGEATATASGPQLTGTAPQVSPGAVISGTTPTTDQVAMMIYTGIAQHRGTPIPSAGQAGGRTPYALYLALAIVAIAVLVYAYLLQKQHQLHP